MTNDTLWQTKLHARLHDPAEKALVLLRDPAGHENGTSKVLRRMAYETPMADDSTLDNDNAEVLHAVAFKEGIRAAIYKTVKRADWWAAAADRPQWPLQEIDVVTKKGEEKTFAVADYAQVRWANQPELVHPLTGARCDLGQYGGLSDSDFRDIKSRSFEHFSKLLVQIDGATDWKKTVLAFWRFGPELREDEDFGKLGALWRLLPADTRIPDHSIWDHLDLTSAFAGAFAGDENGEAALLSLAIGPVQSFIESARTTSDLWAGSHLLSRLAWEAMKPVCAALGPDAILFPRLRGVPQVDLWLRELEDNGGCGLDSDWFKACEWKQGGTDANPLFAAALTNRFVAVVPASQAKTIAESVEKAVRAYLQQLGQTVVNRLLEEAKLTTGGEQHCHEQMREQIEGFPEVHWAAVPFSLIRARNVEKQTDLDVTALSAAMQPFFAGDGAPGFLISPAWQVLQKETRWDDRTTFFAPNPGVLYPAVYDLAERVLAAAKTTRRFDQTTQNGWRCSLTGETEWLTNDKNHLAIPPGKRLSKESKKYDPKEHTETLWTRIADEKPAWAKKGEHLGALPSIKRLWPTLFAQEVKNAVGGDMQRFVVSTHTMALSGQMEQWLANGGEVDDETRTLMTKAETVALPRRLMRLARPTDVHAAKSLPGLLEAARALREAEYDSKHDQQVAERQAQTMEAAVERTLGKSDKSTKLETYYALLLMDGDRMGAWLSGGEDYAITYRESFHSQVQKGIQPFEAKHQALRDYFQQKRALSPNRHLSISAALNDFALTLARFVVEDEHAGRLIYSGGDDVLAMLPVTDLLPAMQQLRAVYSGVACPDARFSGDIELKNGFALLKVRDGEGNLVPKLMRLMGEKATASIGAVIAHHQAPLGAVMRELRAAEKRAKNEGGRDAFSITVIKRSGGDLYLTNKWSRDGEDSPMTCLRALSQGMRKDVGASRGAVYRVQQWSQDLPTPQMVGGNAAFAVLIESLIRDQFSHAANQIEDYELRTKQLVAMTVTEMERRMQNRDRLTPEKFQEESRDIAVGLINNFLAVAEFLARETRAETRP